MESLTSSKDAISIDRVFATKHGLTNAIVFEAVKMTGNASVKQIGKTLPFYASNTISRSIKYLTDSGIIHNGAGDWQEVKQKLLNNEYEKKLECEWCGEMVIVLQEHHYPIPKEQGGTETVNICPNCHYGFHAIVNSYNSLPAYNIQAV